MGNSQKSPWGIYFLFFGLKSSIRSAPHIQMVFGRKISWPIKPLWINRSLNRFIWPTTVTGQSYWLIDRLNVWNVIEYIRYRRALQVIRGFLIFPNFFLFSLWLHKRKYKLDSVSMDRITYRNIFSSVWLEHFKLIVYNSLFSEPTVTRNL